MKSALLFITILFLFGCTIDKSAEQKYKVFKYTTPSNSNLKITLELLSTITVKNNVFSEKNSSYVTLDSRENIYIFDYETKTICKFDSLGNRFRFNNIDLNSISETLKNSTLKYIEYDNSINIFSYESNNYYKFDLDGNIISKNKNKNGKVVDLLESDSCFFIECQSKVIVGSLDCFINYLIKTDKDFNAQDTISIFNIIPGVSLKKRLFFSNYFYPLKNGEIFIPIISRKFYRIHHLDQSLNIKSIITKQFNPIKRTLAEKDMIFKAIYGTLSKDDDIWFKKSIKRNLMMDYKDRLWVIPSIDRKKYNNQGTYVDIFKNDIYINRIFLPNIWRYNPFFIKNDKFIMINSKSNCLQIFKIVDND